MTSAKEQLDKRLDCKISRRNSSQTYLNSSKIKRGQGKGDYKLFLNGSNEWRFSLAGVIDASLSNILREHRVFD